MQFAFQRGGVRVVAAVVVFLSAFALLGMLPGCAKNEESQMRTYLEFYYPTTSASTYSVIFDWGEYVVTTGAGEDATLGPDSEPYRGFITLRPHAADAATDAAHVIYLVTPDGEVWTTPDSTDIAATNSRTETIVEEQSGGGTMTTTRTIESEAEPAIDSFRSNKSVWTRYGTLESKDDETTFTPAGG